MGQMLAIFMRVQPDSPAFLLVVAVASPWSFGVISGVTH